MPTCPASPSAALTGQWRGFDVMTCAGPWPPRCWATPGQVSITGPCPAALASPPCSRARWMCWSRGGGLHLPHPSTWPRPSISRGSATTTRPGLPDRGLAETAAARAGRPDTARAGGEDAGRPQRPAPKSASRAARPAQAGPGRGLRRRGGNLSLPADRQGRRQPRRCTAAYLRGECDALSDDLSVLAIDPLRPRGDSRDKSAM